MSTTVTATVASSDSATVVIDLRDPWLAAFLAWLFPGLGHMYQRRWGKGGLFMTCILGTFFYGLWLGGGRVVYASFRDGDAHYAYLCQVGVGAPALPAVVQTMRVTTDPPKAPLWDGLMAPPMLQGQIVPRSWIEAQQAKNPGDPEFRDFRAINPADPNETYLRYAPEGDHNNQLGLWHSKLGSYFDLGTVFTMIAGLLNILAVWDAWGGPAAPTSKPEVKDKKDNKPKAEKPQGS